MLQVVCRISYLYSFRSKKIACLDIFVHSLPSYKRFAAFASKATKMTSYEKHANNNSRMTSLSKNIAPLTGKGSPNLNLAPI